MGRKRVSPFGEGKTFAERDVDTPIFGDLSEMESQMKILGPMLEELPDEDGNRAFVLMGQLIEMGITPERFEAFYAFYHSRVKPVLKNPKIMQAIVEEEAMARMRDLPYRPGGQAEGDDKRRLLKIQMKGVTKPPMWREVEVPGDMTFADLHKVIQEVVGLSDCHLWQFNKEAYREDIQIGIPMDENDPWGFGVEYVTDDAAQTPVTKYLSKEGDKLEYVYDFGDDWIFTVTVKKVLDSDGERRPPVCKAYKSDLNAMEDIGGPYMYENMRQDLLMWDTYKANQKKKIAADHNFDSSSDYIRFLRDSLFDMADANDYLAMM